MNEEVVIKPLSENDIDALVLISKTTFSDAFAEGNTQENLNLYMEKSFNKGVLLQELQDKDNFFWGAYTYGKLAGYCKLRKNIAPEEITDVPAIELERLYVLKTHQNKGIGAFLMQHCVTYATLNNYKTLWLGVWEHNPDAIRFYRTCGFEVFGSHPFWVGNDLQTDIWMKKIID